MPVDEWERGGAPAADELSSALEPVRPLRTSLRRVDGSLSASSLGPELQRLEQELSAVRKSLRAQRAETRVEKQNNALLRAELATLRNSRERPSEDTADEVSARGIFEHQLDRLRREHEVRERDLELRCAREIAIIEEKQAAKVSALRDSLRVAEELTLAKTERIRRLEERLLRLQSEGVVAPGKGWPGGARGRDDLTVLRGVGPAYVHALRREGVVALSQIAAWSVDDVRDIAPKIGTTQGRIFRDDWVGQARALLRGVPSEG